MGKDGRKIFIDRAEMPASRVRVMMLGGVARFRNTGVVTDFGPFIKDERRAAAAATPCGDKGRGRTKRHNTAQIDYSAAIGQGAGKAKWGAISKFAVCRYCLGNYLQIYRIALCCGGLDQYGRANCQKGLP